MKSNNADRLKLRKIFTLFAKAIRRWRYHGSDPYVGLMFQDFDEPDLRKCEETLRTLMAHPSVATMFEPPYFGIIRPTKDDGQYLLIISQFFQSLRAMYEEDAEVLVWHDERVTKIRLSDAWDNCMDMRKLAQCQGCELPGDPCIQKHIKLPSRQLHLPLLQATGHTIDGSGSQYSEAREYLTAWKTNIAGFTYVPPLYTTQPPAFGVQVGSGDTAYLPGYVEQYKEFCRRAQNGGKTRIFKKEQCSNCALKDIYHGGSCWPYRKVFDRCEHGAWTKEALIQQSLGPIKEKLNKYFVEYEKPFNEWKQILSGLLAIGGERFTLRNPTTHRKCVWHVTGVRFSYDVRMRDEDAVPCLQVIRESLGGKGDIDFGIRQFKTFAELFEFTGPRIKEIFSSAKVCGDEQLAIAAHLCVSRKLRRYQNAYYQHVEPIVDYIRSSGSSVDVGWYVKTKRGSQTFSSLDDFVLKMDRFPLFDHFAKNPEATIRFHGSGHYY
jgi:hypothetical protein